MRVIEETKKGKDRCQNQKGKSKEEKSEGAKRCVARKERTNNVSDNKYIIQSERADVPRPRPYVCDLYVRSFHARIRRVKIDIFLVNVGRATGAVR